VFHRHTWGAPSEATVSPSAGVLRKIAKPLGFEEDELFTLAGYLSSQADTISDTQRSYGEGRLDPYVAKMLAQEPVEVQLSVIGILGMLKSIAKGVAKKEDD